MTTARPIRARTAPLVLAATILVAACGDPGMATTPQPTTTPSDGGASGSVFVSGSSTVEPISSGVAEAFADANPGFAYTVEGPGTGDGFKKFCAGETDISDASRKIKDEEAETCTSAGIEYVELKVAIDGLSLVTSVENEAVACLAFPDLYALIGPESTGFARWSDASALAAELGSTTSFPDAPLTITGPGEESGTFDSFVEIVIAKTAEARGRKGETTRPDYTASANDNAIVDGIAGTVTSLGWVGFAFAEENADKIREIAIAREPGGDCVGPTPTTIADGSYPLSRSLYIYVNVARAKANPAVAAYVDHYLAPGTIDAVLETVPYVALSDEALAESRAAWDAVK